MNFWDLIPPDSREPVELASPCEVRILTKNHKERWLDITATPVDFDGEQSRLFSAFDLTERKQAESQARLLAITDPLTGLGNYRRLLDVLHAEIEGRGRRGRPFAFLLLGLDGLKKINDCHGHLAGSRALCRVGDVLGLFCRAIDPAGRYGGDDFAVVLPETAAAAAGLVASRIRNRLATDSEQPPLSASIGVAAYPHDGETVEALLQTADRELYGMKSHVAVSHMISPAGQLLVPVAAEQCTAVDAEAPPNVRNNQKRVHTEQGGHALAEAVRFDSECSVPGWRLVKDLDRCGLDQEIREAGWTFFYLAGE